MKVIILLLFCYGEYNTEKLMWIYVLIYRCWLQAVKYLVGNVFNKVVLIGDINNNSNAIKSSNVFDRVILSHLKWRREHNEDFGRFKW